MNRKDELLAMFGDLDENVCTIVAPLIDDLVFIENQLVELKKLPFIKVHPIDGRQKTTPAAKLYKEMLATQKDIVRILCSQLHKGGEGEGESPLRIYLKTLETR